MDTGDESHPSRDNQPIPSFLRSIEAAGLLSRTMRTIRNWAKNGQLPKKPIVRSVFFVESEIAALIESANV